MKYKETRYLFADDLRNLCIKHRWYTKGACADYNHLLYDLADRKNNLGTDDIIEIAKDIIAHSEIDPEFGDVTTVAYLVNCACMVLFQEDEN